MLKCASLEYKEKANIIFFFIDIQTATLRPLTLTKTNPIKSFKENKLNKDCDFSLMSAILILYSILQLLQ